MNFLHHWLGGLGPFLLHTPGIPHIFPNPVGYKIPTFLLSYYGGPLGPPHTISVFPLLRWGYLGGQHTQSWVPAPLTVPGERVQGLAGAVGAVGAAVVAAPTTPSAYSLDLVCAAKGG